MRGLHFSLLTALALTGCDSVNKPKVDNPVMGPPPPRYTLENNANPLPENPLLAADDVKDVSALDYPNVKVASLERLGNNPLADSQTVAIVNGSPILASEVLERYGSQLAVAREKLPPEQFEEARRMLIKKDLDGHIERKLLADGLRAMLQPEQIEMLNAYINEQFNKEVARMMTEAKVTTRIELDEELRKQHTSLERLKTNFTNQRMAMEYLGTKTKSEDEPGRPELLAYYNENREDYFIPARVKWQQILVNHRDHGGEFGARDHLNKIVAEMRPTRGANFTEVAKEYSDGPNAANGGRWEWTKQGSLADKKIDQALFELPEGRPSQVFERDDAFKIVMVSQREDGHYRPFNEVQDEIKQTLDKESRRKAAEAFIDKTVSEADITTIFDEPKTKLVNGNEDELPFRIQ